MVFGYLSIFSLKFPTISIRDWVVNGNDGEIR